MTRGIFTSLDVLIDCVGGLVGQNGVYIFGEELDGKLVTEGPDEKDVSRPGELGEGTHTVYDQANMRAEKQLTKTTECNVKICEKRVHPVKFHVGSKACYLRPCRYVDRGPKRRCNYSGPFWVVKIHSPEAVSIQRCQRSEVLLVLTEKSKLFLCTALFGRLDHIDGPFTLETGTTGPWDL